MVEAGVTGVLNVQTDGDHQRRMVNWNSMEKYYHEAGIHAIRVPIEDFNGEELARLVKEGAKAVDQLVHRAKVRSDDSMHPVLTWRAERGEAAQGLHSLHCWDGQVRCDEDLDAIRLRVTRVTERLLSPASTSCASTASASTTLSLTVRRNGRRRKERKRKLKRRSKGRRRG